MADEEWFQTAWSDQQLFEQYNDERLDDMRREHAFTGYWKRRANHNMDQMLPKTDVDEMLKYHRWWGALSDVVDRLIWQERLSEEDCHRLLEVMPENSAGRESVKTFLILRSGEHESLDRRGGSP